MRQDSGYPQQDMGGMHPQGGVSGGSLGPHGQQFMPQQDWDQLSDVSRQMDEHDVEPDYFIDRAPMAEFVKPEEGVDKEI